MKKMLLFLALALIISVSLSAESILVVDHDLSEEDYTDCWPAYESALIANGYTYTYYQVASGDLVTPDLATMQAHDCVIWFSGECWGYFGQDCMTTASENKVADYLDGGGSLFFAGQDYLWSSYPSAGALNPGQFPHDYLGLAQVSQDEWFIEDPDFVEVEGVEFSCAAGFSFTASDIFTTVREGLYVDQITSYTADAMGLFNVTSPSPEGHCAVQKDTGTFRSIFSTLAFAAIDDSTTQHNLLGAMVDWLIDAGNEVENETITQNSFTNAPNPFANSTTFKFSLKEPARVKIDIYNVEGQLVKNLVNDELNSTNHSVTWNGKDEAGKKVSPGIYFTKVSAGNVSDVHKILIIK
ncbi:MAG: T9SS type A sorting domain-containing protein [Candidatus Cloacimonetes bacterium]|nr:T9SS type A sorting domain-containing protein [Candidatus Cloacimonadota bacterium]